MKSLAVLNECSFSGTQIQYLKGKFPDSVFYTDTNSEDLAIERITHRNIVILDQFMFSFSEKLLKKCSGLELIIVNTTAHDSIDMDLLKKYKVQLAYLKEYATVDVAEVALSMILQLNNRTQTAQELVTKHRVTDIYPNHPLLPTVKRKQLASQTIGIIGIGNIGQRCAKVCTSLGMNVIGFNRTKKDGIKIPLTTLKSLCKLSDIVLITLAYKKGEMDGIISKELLSVMKKGTILVSVSHPKLMDMDYLINNHDKFAGLGFDYLVTDQVRKLMKKREKNIIITPHLGSQSEEAISKMTNSLIKIAADFN